MVPPLASFTPAERRVIARLRTPELVQRYLNRLPYNTEPKGETLRGFREVVRRRTAHCCEAALTAACILEQHRFPPLLLTFESVDLLDHVLFVYRWRDRWGTVARSRDPGLHGRKPVFRTLRALAMSYFDPYIDPTGCITGYAMVDLRKLGSYDWRFSRRNMWAVTRFLIGIRHTRLKVPRARVKRVRAWYVDYRATHDGKKPLAYRGRDKWTEIPREFR
jgi:hypothetical protein